MQVDEDHIAALEHAAARDETGAMALLGMHLMSAHGVERNARRGADLIFAAAGRDHPEALEMAASILAGGVARPQDLEGAVALLRRAADLGEPRARAQLRLLEGIDLDSWRRPPPGKVLNPSPLLVAFEAMLPPAFAAWFQEKARGALVDARIFNTYGNGLVDARTRSNTAAEIPGAHADVITALVRSRMAAAAGLPLHALEPPSVLHYLPGQTFTRHFDFFEERFKAHAVALREGGQRVATCLVYLNDEFEGGETEFPMLGLKHRGGAGDGLLFMNVSRDGVLDRRTLHAGLTPTSGQKWLLSQFMRDRAQSWH